MGDLLTSDRRIHWESMDTQQCLCCKKDCLESLEHLFLDCDALKDERINLLWEMMHNETWPISDLNNNVHKSGMEIIKMLPEIRKELEEKEWKVRMELAGKMFEVRRKTYKNKEKIVKGVYKCNLYRYNPRHGREWWHSRGREYKVKDGIFSFTEKGRDLTECWIRWSDKVWD